ncbi:UvrD-helicase domain-containing protein [Streptomyces sp. MS19]|uniref:UvrD-helicase domain-containing protein n=1 Tax=Streptomyces sp. MS19 TaxID=3385972 RepID=UPI00399F2A50
MTIDGTGDPLLTDEQRAVVRLPAKARTLVTAGPGAGKTHTLVCRVQALVTADDLGTGEILVLTFSRSAVRELRERLARAGEATRHVRVTTFDSWALEVLEEVAADIDWRARPFDDRVRAAADVVADASRAPEWLAELRHVVIDEVQDLVGERRGLVEVLLDAYDFGFTIVGDPAQAIHGYQSTDDAERAEAGGFFLRWLRRTFVDELVELSLTRNFRARTGEAGCVLSSADALRSCDTLPAALRAHENLRTALAGLMDFGDVSVPFIRESLLDTGVTTAVLCRTNGEALLISEWLHAAAVPHQLRRAAQERAAPPWTTELLRGPGGAGPLTKERFTELLPSLPLGTSDGQPEALWRALKSVAGDRSGRTLAPARLRDALAGGRLPDELTAQAAHPLVVSTYHRAKGLEFDRVLVVDPGEPTGGGTPDAADVADLARALYVAMTRPRDELYRLVLPPSARPDVNGVRAVRRDPVTRRWARFGPRKWQRLGLELRAGDIHTALPGGAHLVAADATKVQDVLRAVVSAGDPLELIRLDSVPEDHTALLAPGYALRHEEGVIGVTSTGFRGDLYRFLRQYAGYRPRNWPRRITGLRLDTIESVAGERGAAARPDFGPHDVWLAPRVVGIGRFHYDERDRGPDGTADRDSHQRDR